MQEFSPQQDWGGGDGSANIEELKKKHSDEPAPEKQKPAPERGDKAHKKGSKTRKVTRR